MEESLTILESLVTPPFSNSSSSLGTDQGIQRLIVLSRAALQTQGGQKEARQNEAGQGGADQNQRFQNRTQLAIDQNGSPEANVVKPVTLRMRLVNEEVTLFNQP